MGKLKRERSEALYTSAKKYFPGGVNSPVRAFKAVGGTPLFIKEANGAYVTDEDDNVFLDFCGSWGPLILGHAEPSVVHAITETAARGTSFGAPTALENQLAELILNNHKYIERLRFVSSGTEAVMSAIRLARGYTERDLIVKFEGCYHGHSDSLLVKAGSGLVTFGESSSAGVPDSFVKNTLVIALDDFEVVKETFQQHGKNIAAVIIEPVPANNGLLLQSKEFLTFLRQITKEHGSLLIFDEVISGFRLGFEGAAGTFGIAPDIITFGKIIGGGLPVGAYGATGDIMESISPEGPVYQAGTLSGNPVAMAAGKAQLSRCLKENFYTDLSERTGRFCESVNAYAIQESINFRMVYTASIFWPVFSKVKMTRATQIDSRDMEKFKLLHAILLENGIYFGPSGYEVGFVSAAHTDQNMEQAAEVFKKGIKQVDQLMSAS